MAKVDLSELNGAQRRLLEQAIVAAFTRTSLDKALQHNDWQPLENFLEPGPWADQVFELVKWTLMQGRTDKLVTILQTENPDNPKIRTLYSDLGFALVAAADVPKLIGGSLQRTVRERAGFADFGKWLDKFMAYKGQVCRIEDSGRDLPPLGTGFLVGPDLVLTNFHVVQAYVAAGGDRAGLACRFDYAVESSGTNDGTLKALADGAAWLIDSSPFSAVDPGDRGGLPTLDELDYALIRLKEPAGADVVAGGGKRGWIAASKMPPVPAADDTCFIVQHPKGEPVKLAVGAFMLRNDNGTRIRYDANTEPGSSGSPCFDAKLDLVALHHGGGPDTKKLAPFNQGIPIRMILDRLSKVPDMPQFWTE